MKDVLKIALGIILAVLGLVACALCALFIFSMGGVALLSSSVDLHTPTKVRRLVTSPPSLTPTPTPVKSDSYTPSPIPTSVPLLSEGEWTQLQGLSLAVIHSEVMHTCPGGYGQPAEGAKFVIISVAVRNTSSDVVDLPSMDFELNGYQSGLGTSGDCRYDEKSFGNACWESAGKLYPDVMCEGWELFEVPEKLTLEDKVVGIKIDTQPGVIDLAGWQLNAR